MSWVHNIRLHVRPPAAQSFSHNQPRIIFIGALLCLAFTKRSLLHKGLILHRGSVEDKGLVLHRGSVED